MGCNAWNHPSDCDCGWGGDTGGGYGGGDGFLTKTQVTEGLVNPNARCPVCGERVYYFESSNGGKVWFDQLGVPWPKHPCMETRSETINSYGELLEFIGAKLTPVAAMEMAAELVRYAMTDFRYPKREWPDDELLDARLELLDWMYRRHEMSGEHIVPLNEFLQIVGYIEDRAKMRVQRLATVEKLQSVSQKSQGVDLGPLFEGARQGRGTLAIMAQLREYFENRENMKESGLKLVED